MDFWDLTKLLWRRWYFAVPLLIATVLGTAYLTSTVKPDFVLTSHVLLTPVPIRDDSPASQAALATNPWVSLGSGALAQSAKLSIEGADVLEDLNARGLSDSYVVSVVTYSPIITIEVVAVSEAQAVATTNALFEVFEANVRHLQVSQGAVDSALMGVERLPGDRIEERDANVKRVMVAVGAAGLLLSFGITVALDALVRRRRRSMNPVDPFAGAPVTGPLPPEPAGGGRRGAAPGAATTYVPHAPTSPVPQVPPRPEAERRTSDEADPTIVLPMSVSRGNKRPGQ